MRRFASFLALTLMLTIALGIYGAWWWLISDSMNEELDKILAQASADGHPITYASRDLDGFPMQLRVHLTDVTMAGNDGIKLHIPDLVAVARPWYPTHLLWHADEQNRMIFPTDDDTKPNILTAASMNGLVDYSMTVPGFNLGLNLPKLTFEFWNSKGQPKAVQSMGATVNLNRHDIPDLDSRSNAGANIAGRAQIDLPDIHLVSTGAMAVAAAVASGRPAKISVSAVLRGPMPVRFAAPELTTWRDNHGVIDLTDLNITWGPVIANGSATAALDTALQPQFSGMLTITGAADMLKDMIAAHELDDQEAALAKWTLGGLAGTTQTDRTAPVISLPLSLEDRNFTVGGYAVATFAPIVWPQ